VIAAAVVVSAMRLYGVEMAVDQDAGLILPLLGKTRTRAVA